MYKELGVNRLIIIGNGFDLAHGLKTSYNHFIKWIFKDYFKKNKYAHLLFNPLPNFSLQYNKERRPISKLDFLKECIANRRHVDIINGFFQVLIKRQHLNKWVDIENEYYRLLLMYATNNSFTNREELILKLNEELEVIKDLLEKYLTDQVDKYKGNEIDLGYDDLFFPKKSKTKGQEHPPRKSFVHILNFNYTNIPKLYLDKFKTNNPNNSLECTITNIHGELNNKNNPIIFGYGDEKDKQFDDILHHGNNELFRNVKHYKYLQNYKLTELEGFFTKNPPGSQLLQKFEVLIFGHSCGNSDRTLLNMIFEKQELSHKGIKIFLRDTEDKEKQRLKYENITIQISRTLTNSGSIRDRVKKFQDSEVMPSVKGTNN